MISSLSNAKIKETLKLRESKHRRRTKTFLIDGRREIDSAVRSGIRILEIFAWDNVLQNNVQEGSILKHCRYLNIPLCVVSEGVLQKIAFGDRNEGFVAVAQEPERNLQAFETAVFRQDLGHPVFLAVVENIEKPGNLGAVFRSADAAGVDGIMITYDAANPNISVEVFHPNTIRSSLGTVFHLPSVTLDSQTAWDYLRKHGVRLALAKCDSAVPYTHYDYRPDTAVVFGSEALGLSRIWQSGGGDGCAAVSLPMLGIADSLNVSVAAGILFYEALRQRTGEN
jgi:TrmH family RNA methyltransferase